MLHNFIRTTDTRSIFFFRLTNFVVILHKIPRHFERHDNDKKKMIYIYLLKKNEIKQSEREVQKKTNKRETK